MKNSFMKKLQPLAFVIALIGVHALAQHNDDASAKYTADHRSQQTQLVSLD